LAYDAAPITEDVGRELFGIYFSLLLLYSWCLCSGMSRL
jgi:hypothetical protein